MTERKRWAMAAKVPDEMTGLAWQARLRGAGLDAVLQNMNASFYGGVLNVFQGYWGKLLVPESQLAAAREALAEWEDGPGDPSPFME